MRLSILSFTEQGRRLSERIAGLLAEDAGQGNGRGLTACLYTKCKACKGEGGRFAVLPVETSVGEWAKGQMQERNILLFIGACGIAVRAIAPYLTDKLHDPPVLVMDEKGNYVIPILSGHMGGANRIAAYLAGKTGAEPVITTATDLNQAFAVDVFAKENGCSIADKNGIVKVSSKALAGKALTMSIEPGHSFFVEGKTGKLFPMPIGPGDNFSVEGKAGKLFLMPVGQGDNFSVEGKEGKWITKPIRPEDNFFAEGKDGSGCLPGGIQLVPYPPAGAADIVVTSEKREFHASALLQPKEYIIGMGCKKGKSIEEINGLVQKKMGELGISAAQVLALASVSQKSREPGLVGWCQKEGILFLAYTAEELQQVQGTFQESSFVRSQVGVGNVCERAALKACEETWAASRDFGIRGACYGDDGPIRGKGKLVLPKHAENGMTIAVAKREWRVCFYGA